MNPTDATGVVVAETLVLSYDDNDNEFQESPLPSNDINDQMTLLSSPSSSLNSKLEIALMSTNRFRRNANWKQLLVKIYY